jgi:hypothetical protein
MIRSAAIVSALAVALLAAGCGDTPNTSVVLDNDYAPSGTNPLVVYRAYWQAVSFANPITPGSSSFPQGTVAASDNTAYVVLAPSWDPNGAPPTSFVVMESRNGFAAHLDTTLHIPVDDATFVGNCAARSFLSQAQADFITQLVFPNDFASLRYDAASCTTAPTSEAGAP